MHAWIKHLLPDYGLFLGTIIMKMAHCWPVRLVMKALTLIDLSTKPRKEQKSIQRNLKTVPFVGLPEAMGRCWNRLTIGGPIADDEVSFLPSENLNDFFSCGSVCNVSLYHLNAFYWPNGLQIYGHDPGRTCFCACSTPAWCKIWAALIQEPMTGVTRTLSLLQYQYPGESARQLSKCVAYAGLSRTSAQLTADLWCRSKQFLIWG